MASLPTATYHWQRLPIPMGQDNTPQLWICTLQAPVAEVAGNKWLKLHSAIQQRKPGQGLLSFGGAFSNHLVALAAAGQHYHFPTIGLVRTEQLDMHNPTLRRCRELGMQLIALDRISYRQQQQPEFLVRLKITYPEYLILPEGGSDLAGAAGVGQLPLLQTPDGDADLLCCATASGGTLAGLIQRYPEVRCLGLPVVKDASLADRIKQCLPPTSCYQNWQLAEANSAYGKVNAELVAFCCQLKQHYQLSTEPIYTGKALQLLSQLLQTGSLSGVKRIAFFHTGGLQGLHGLYYRRLLTEAQYRLLLS